MFSKKVHWSKDKDLMYLTTWCTGVFYISQLSYIKCYGTELQLDYFRLDTAEIFTEHLGHWHQKR